MSIGNRIKRLEKVKPKPPPRDATAELQHRLRKLLAEGFFDKDPEYQRAYQELESAAHEALARAGKRPPADFLPDRPRGVRAAAWRVFGLDKCDWLTTHDADYFSVLMRLGTAMQRSALDRLGLRFDFTGPFARKPLPGEEPGHCSIRPELHSLSERKP
jgi:hypothetical protein